MSQLSGSKTVPAELSSRARMAAQQLMRTPVKNRHPLSHSVPVSCNRPVSGSPFKSLSPSVSASARMCSHAQIVRQERMEEIALLAARRRSQGLERSSTFSYGSPQYTRSHDVQLSGDPTEWTPPQMAHHLASVLGLVSKALRNDVRRWTCSEGLDGMTFLCLSDQDISRMGMSTGWTKTIIKSRDELRERCNWESSRDHQDRYHSHLAESANRPPIKAFSFGISINETKESPPLQSSIQTQTIESQKIEETAVVSSRSESFQLRPEPKKGCNDSNKFDPSRHRRRPSGGPSTWAELGSFILWASLGLTLLTGRFFAIKTILFFRRRANFFGLQI